MAQEFRSHHTVLDTDVTMLSHHNGGRMHKFIVQASITKEQACDIQTALGYHPAGYGFYSFDATLSETTWKCGDNCD